MSARALVSVVLVGWTALGSVAWAQGSGGTGANRPNIVFILIDDAGFSDFGSYGSEIATPNIDAIAREGVRFTNFHTASTCESSRTMLQSGVDNHLAGAGTLQVVIADNQRGKPGYEGYLSDRVHSLGQLMHDGGYATYYAGKWNIGAGVEHAPGARGWDRYLALENTGADNYEAKVYAPFNLEAVWWEDGHRAVLPPDFYSSRYYVDKMIRFVDDGRANGKPFFAMIAFQAVHSPLQAPNPYIAKYLSRYDVGWERIRAERYRREVALGIAPAGLTLPVAPGRRPWDTLTTEDQRTFAKKMAVYAGMLDAADEQVGRFRDHLQQIGALSNTVFMVMSDNGADAYDLSQLNIPFRIWYHVNDKLGYDSLGEPGSYVHYGQDWAEVSNTPFKLFKGTSAEGGMRVPFILDAPGRVKGGAITNEFAYATDFLPTVLDLAGIAMPGETYRGQKLIRPTGFSMLPYLEGKAASIHPAGEAIGFEGTGGQALFQDGYKLMRNAFGADDGRWHLYRMADDWTESNDLAASDPGRVQALIRGVQRYNEVNGVVLPAAGYDPFRQLLRNNYPILLRQLGPPLAAVLVGVVILAWFLYWGIRRVWRGRSSKHTASRASA